MSNPLPQVVFKPVSADNWRQALKLKLVEGQEKFVAPNWYTIIQGHFENLPVYVIYNGEGDDAVMVGLTMYGYAEDSEDGVEIKGYEIVRLMFDKDHQNKGYGRASLNKIIAELKANPECKDIYIMFEPDNVAARHLYTSVGFTDTGKVMNGECIFHMPGK